MKSANKTAMLSKNDKGMDMMKEPKSTDHKAADKKDSSMKTDDKKDLQQL